MEFIQLTTVDGVDVMINISHIVAVTSPKGVTMVVVPRHEQLAVKESMEYIAKHLYVCNKSYVNGVKEVAQ